jgi:hypothetical protein
MMDIGDPREATSLGRQALKDANALRSHRIVDELRGLARVAEPHERIEDVAELRHGIATLSPPEA